ncbi:MAG: histidine phosphatase family protein [Spirochaetes bacterium]|nr:histidine phosphatase family protein [Spirochaetota bacterium]
MNSEKQFKLFVIRHGETLWNKELRIQGFRDSPLTYNGIKQTEYLGKYLKNKYFFVPNFLQKYFNNRYIDNFLSNFNLISYRNSKENLNKKFYIDYAFSSDLGRAIQTAEILKKYLKFQYEKKAELREKNFGIFEGLTLNEIIEKYPEYKNNFFEKVHSYSFKIPAGESNEDLMNRVINFTFSLLNVVENDSNVLFITHGGVVESIFKFCFDLKDINIRKYSLNNCSINIFEVKKNFIKLLVWGEIPYSIENDVKLK